MKYLLTALLLLTGLSAKAQIVLPSFVHVATFTLTGTGQNVLAFQNISPSQDIVVTRVNVFPIVTGAVTSGPVAFHVFLSTRVTHGGTSQVSGYSNETVNTTPSFVTMSTGPVSVQLEDKQTRSLPVHILLANPDESVSTFAGQDLAPFVPIILPKNKSRALVLRQMQYGATDWTAGVVMVQVAYTVK